MSNLLPVMMYRLGSFSQRQPTASQRRSSKRQRYTMAPTTTTEHTSTSSDETPSHDATTLDLLGDMDTPATAIVADHPDQNNGGIVDSVIDDDKVENEIHGTMDDPVTDDNKADEDDEFQDFEDADDGAINAEIMEHQTEPRPKEVDLVTMMDKVDVNVFESTNAEMNGTDKVKIFNSDISAEPKPGTDEDTTDDDFGDFEDAVADSSSSANGLVMDASNHSGETSNGFQDGITTTKELEANEIEPPAFPEVPCDDVMDGPILSAPTKTTENDFAGPYPSTETEQYKYEFSGASSSSVTKPTENELASSIPSTEMKPTQEEEEHAVAIPSTEINPAEAEFAGPLAPREIDDNTQTTHLETPVATTTKVPSLVDGDDDDFGDFTDAPLETQTDETKVQSIDISLANEPVQENNQPFEDDFGDFEDAPVAGHIDENLPTSSSTLNPDVPNQDANKPSGGDEDDDFGDFGNFSDFQEPNALPSEPSPATVDSIKPFQLEIQSIIESSRNALAGVFGTFSDVDEQTEEADNTLLDNTVVTVRSVMVSHLYLSHSMPLQHSHLSNDDV